MNVPIDWPKVYWQDGDEWIFSYVEAGKAKQVLISKRNAAILAKSLGDAFEREFRDGRLVEWQHRVAI